APRQTPPRRRQSWRPAGSYRALLDAAKQALRTPHDDRDQNEERKGAAIGRGHIGGRKIIENAKNEAAENSAAHLIEAADNGGKKRGDTERLAVNELGKVDRAD